MTTLRPSHLRGYLRTSWRILLKELTAFGVVGAMAFVIDLGIFTWLTPHGALKAKLVSTIVSTTFAYFGNRQWSFSHRARTTISRETTFFFGINLVTLIFSELLIGLFVYGFGFDHKSFVIAVVNVVSIGLGTIFRFWAYKRFVFLHPENVHARNVDLESELSE